jgi:hypothetical protein
MIETKNCWRYIASIYKINEVMLDSDPNKRPTANELVEILTFWFDYYPNDFCWNTGWILVPSKIKT